jgi:hypothetical protein
VSRLTDNPELVAAVGFSPGEIVVVVDFFNHRCAEDPRDTIADPIAAHVEIAPSSGSPRTGMLPTNLMISLQLRFKYD